MGGDAQALLREALSLSDEDRAEIATELLASLEDADVDDPVVAGEMWRREIERRAQRVLEDRSEGDDWSVLRQRLTDELAGG